MTDTETVEALTKSVVAIDASRRVGWAKSFEATSREETAQRDLNVARGDLAIVSKFAAYAVGILQGIKFDHLLQPQYQAPGPVTYLPDGPRREGQERARAWLDDEYTEQRLANKERQRLANKERHLDEVTDRLEAKIAQRKARADELKRENSKTYKSARAYERKYLMRKFAIPHEDALLDWLSKYTEQETL